MKKRISTAAYLAGVTTIAVSLPMMAHARTSDADLQADKGVQKSQEVLLESDQT